jgi:hypothetical protein
MSLKPLIVMIGFAAASMMFLIPPVAAQVITAPDIVTGQPPGSQARPHAARSRHLYQPAATRPRIEIHPGRLLYRRCADWYELQNRPSGTVLYPQMRCWWVRG